MQVSKEYVLKRLLTKASEDYWLSMIQKAKEDHKLYRMHVHGVGLEDFIKKIEGLENEQKIKLRKRLSRSNRELWADVLRPTDKLFTAQGGSRQYNILNETQEKRFKEKINTLYKGSSFRQWFKSYFVDKNVTDPNGVFLIEHKNGKAYPTYKSILGIYDYKQVGLTLEYIIFEPYKKKIGGKDWDFVRVYDERGDYTYLVDKDKEIIYGPDDELHQEYTEFFPNPWGRVPSVLCSDTEDTLTEFKRSAIYEQIELANEYLRLTSVNTLQYYHHGFAKFWKHGMPCRKCQGTGHVVITGKEREAVNGLGYRECPSCKGKGTLDKEDVSDVTYISPPKEGQSSIAPNVMGYITPPIDSLKQLDEKTKELRDQIYQSHWGTIIDRESRDKTAFEAALNTQPMQDRLNQYADAAENIEAHLMNLLLDYYVTSHQGANISYGRNYIIHSTSDLLSEYYTAKEKKASETVLNQKLKAYYNALYQSDPMMLDISLKLMQIEPFVHHSMSEVLSFQNVPTEMVRQKVHYNDWLSTYTNSMIIQKDLLTLKQELQKYANERTESIPVNEG